MSMVIDHITTASLLAGRVALRLPALAIHPRDAVGEVSRLGAFGVEQSQLDLRQPLGDLRQLLTSVRTRTHACPRSPRPRQPVPRAPDGFYRSRRTYRCG
ncbi:hypothetical protein, partial [Streptomyces sp. NPDC048411]|uniref:hypothetical protein n=1 Tax=Streptomyces sp. NPDC048411 TaxID=3157206 RepID=UPI00345642CC